MLIAVHNGVMHADDLIFVSLIKKEYYGIPIKIIRTRDEQELNKADIIGDVGLKYDGVRWFDHHQTSVPTYSNGIKMSACGLYLKSMKSLTEEEKQYLLNKALYSVQANDNGQNLIDLNINLPANPFSFVTLLNNNWKIGVYNKQQDNAFHNALFMVQEILDRLIINAQLNIKVKEQIKTAVERWQSDIIDIGDYCPWNEEIININNGIPIFKIVMYRSDDNQYCVQTVNKAIDSYDSWVSIPEDVSKLEGFLFRHKSGFLAKFNNYDSAYQAATLAISR